MKRIDPKIMDKAVARYLDGMGCARAAKGLCAKPTLQKELRRRGIRPRGKFRPTTATSRVDRAIARYQAGATLAEAAAGLMAESTLRRHMDQRGIARRPSSGKKCGPHRPERTLAIYWRYRRGESSKQIGKSLGISGQSVLYHVWRAESLLLDQRYKNEAA